MIMLIMPCPRVKVPLTSNKIFFLNECAKNSKELLEKAKWLRHAGRVDEGDKLEEKAYELWDRAVQEKFSGKKFGGKVRLNMHDFPIPIRRRVIYS